MSGSKEGRRKARETLIKKFGSLEAYLEFYRTIGAKGGKISQTGGFASWNEGSDGLTGRERASIAGAKGGKATWRKIKYGS